MGTRETLRSVIDAGRTNKRLDELSTARVIGKAAEQLHAAQQKAGGKAIGPITPTTIAIASSGAITLELGDTGKALAYSAPEQVSGAGGDRRSDVFGLGAVMWEALTHQQLFDAPDDAAIKAAIADREIASPTELNANIPAELSAICTKALARNPADRYHSPKVMAAEIEAVLDDAGYGDSDDQIAAYLTELGKRPTPPMSPASFLNVPTAEPPAARPAPVSPKAELPSVLKPKEAKQQTLPPPGTLTPPAPKIEPVVAIPKADTLPLPAITTPPATKPETIPPALTVHPVPAGRSESAPLLVPAGVAIANALASAKPAAPSVLSAPPTTIVPDAPVLPSQTLQGVTATAIAVEVAALATPHPVTAVNLGPIPASQPGATTGATGATGRESQEVLGGWGWGTDSHAAIPEYEEPAVESNRKPLLYVIGGGVALMLVVIVIAIGFSGSKKTPPTTTAAKETTETPVVAPTPAPVVPDNPPPTGSADGSGSAVEVAAIATDAAPEPAVVPPPEPPKPVVEPPKPEPPKPVVVAKPEPPKPEPPKPKPVVAKPEPPKPSKPDRVAKVDLKPTKPKPPKSDEMSHADVDTAYRLGLQQFARGDTSGALASLRTSLAGNPNYPPTWRGLGLVFEKMGEKDQARAAYKRYLQLAPSAGDAEQIRGRLERLGT